MSSSVAASDLYDDGEYRRTDVPSKKRINPLLVRTVTGKVRPTTYRLPSSGFTYGKRDQMDSEGVREIVGSWQEHVPNPEGKPGRDFVKLNKKALSEGVVSSSDMANFRRTNDIRMKAKIDDHSAQLSWPAAIANMTFGRPSRPSTPIHAVICNAYQRSWIEEHRTRSASPSAKKSSTIGRFRSSAHTRASLGHMKVEAPAAPEPFKMKKFSNVESKVLKKIVEKKSINQKKGETSQEGSVLTSAGQQVAEQTAQ